MRTSLLNSLQAFVEHGDSQGSWSEWWASNANLVHSEFGRYIYLTLSKHGYQRIQDILSREGIDFTPSNQHCQSCGRLLFQVIPGTTTTEQILSFAESGNLKSRQDIEKTGWLHPGQYCPQGCTWQLWNINTSDV